jgi:hypothetical protein
MKAYRLRAEGVQATVEFSHDHIWDIDDGLEMVACASDQGRRVIGTTSVAALR